MKKGLHDLFRKAVQKAPNKTAVSFGDEQLTYKELDQFSDHYAARLLENGVGKNDLVGMCFDRNLEMIVALLSIAKVGAVYVPIDPAYPDGRRNYIVEDSQMKWMLTQTSTRSLFSQEKLDYLILDLQNELIETSSKPIPTEIDFEGAYVIYTSGTTGKPKGVLVDHSNAVRLFEQTEKLFDFQSTDVWSLFHSICFDFSVWEVWGALIHGAELVVVPYNVSRSPARFYELVAKKGITILNQTPSAFRNFVAEDKVSSFDKLKLRYVIFGGEKLEYNLVNQWVSLNGAESPELINMYGITETTVHVTFKAIRAEEIEKNQPCSIGVPIPDLEVHILDENGEAVADGEVGEMHISGPGVVRGYLHKPELTSERFIQKEMNGASLRLYRSGDLAKRDSTGEIHFAGRIDDQIKLNGFRIEPKELESIACEMDHVSESQVLKVELSEEDHRLINFVLVSDELSDQDQLREKLKDEYKRKVPSHMRPYQTVVLSEYPKTSNGKLDKKTLIENYLKEGDKTSNQKVSVGNIPERSEGIWEELLEVNSVDHSMDIFDQGVTSLSLIQLLNMTKESFGIQLNMGRFVDGFTLDKYVSEVYREVALDLWNSIVETPEDSEDEDFFDLGGTSLSLIQLINETKEKLSIDLVMSHFVEGLTMRAYLNEIEQNTKILNL